MLNMRLCDLPYYNWGMPNFVVRRVPIRPVCDGDDTPQRVMLKLCVRDLSHHNIGVPYILVSWMPLGPAPDADKTIRG